LKENARAEFEQARHERNPEMVSRMLVVGRDALNQTMEKVREREGMGIEREQRERVLMTMSFICLQQPVYLSPIVM
jgi:hypothetical protein